MRFYFIILIFSPLLAFAQGDNYLPAYQDMSVKEIKELGLKKISVTGKAYLDFKTDNEQAFEEFTRTYEFDKEGRLTFETTEGDPGSWRKTYARHLYGGDKLLQSEFKTGPDPSVYVYYRYDKEGKLMRMESQKSESAINREEDGSYTVETFNKHDYPRKSRSIYDKEGNLVSKKEYKQGPLNAPILFKILHQEFDGEGNMMLSVDSSRRSFKDTLKWNVNTSKFEYDQFGRLVRQLNTVELMGSRYRDEKTMLYGASGGRRTRHCSPPEWPDCSLLFEGYLSDESGRKVLDFQGYEDSALLTRITYNSAGLVKSTVTETGLLENITELTDLPEDIEESWQQKLLDREENFTYEFYDQD